MSGRETPLGQMHSPFAHIAPVGLASLSQRRKTLDLWTLWKGHWGIILGFRRLKATFVLTAAPGHRGFQFTRSQVFRMEKLLDLWPQLLSQVRVLVEQPQALIHLFLNHLKVGLDLKAHLLGLLRVHGGHVLVVPQVCLCSFCSARR